MATELERFEYFVCICGDEAESAKKMVKAEAMVDEVCERLGVERNRLLTGVVYSLEFDFEASITGMFADQWAAVSAKREEYNRDATEDAERWTTVFATYIQCDILEHGLAKTWLAFAERYPEMLEDNGDN